MSTYNADTDYELIDYFGLFDLANARVIQAQINSINGEANSASITLSGECADLAAVGTSEVKFFYHCENSTGTLEDLANGYKAFTAGDFVYCLYMPYASDAIPERFFIVGHVDKKGTQRCRTGDYLIISMGLHTFLNPRTGVYPQEYWFTMYDTASGETLDLVSFIPLPDSPPAPSAFPCKATDETSAWINHNFASATPSHYCPLEIEEYDSDITLISEITDTDFDCTYHTRIEISDGGIEDAFAHAEWSSPDWENNEYDHLEATRTQITHIPPTRTGWRMYDWLTSAYKYAFLGMDIEVNGSASVIRGNASGSTASASVEFTITCASEANGESFPRVSFSASAPFGDGFDQIIHPDVISTKMRGVSAVGYYGLYVLCTCADTYYASSTSADIQMWGGDFSSPCDEMAGIAQVLPYPWEFSTVYERDPVHTFGISYCFVTVFDEVPGEKPYNLSAHLCMAHSNSSKSRGLEATFAELKKKIFELTNDDTLFGSWAWEPPASFGALTKKVPENA